jgi:hypothetical protein
MYEMNNSSKVSKRMGKTKKEYLGTPKVFQHLKGLTVC